MPTDIRRLTSAGWVDVLSTEYLKLSGGTLTGFLTLHANPSTNLQAATKQYVDTQVATQLDVAEADARYLQPAAADTAYVNVGGDTMTGLLTLPVTTPSTDNHATRKKYVDDQDAANSVADRSYTDTQVATRLTPAAADTAYVNVGGDTMTGALRLPDSGALSLSSTTHGFQIGGSASTNMAFDSNEIQARSNGAATLLSLNTFGGMVRFGAVTNGMELSTAGNLVVDGSLQSGGSLTIAGNASLGGNNTLTGSTTMFGNLTMSGGLIAGLPAPTAAGHAASKSYVDGEITSRAALNPHGNAAHSGSGFLPISGGAMEGSVSSTGRWQAGNESGPTSTNVGASIRPDGSIGSTCNAMDEGNIVLKRIGGVGQQNAGQTFIALRRENSAPQLIGAITIASATTVAYGGTSDYRLKDEKGPITDALDRLSQLRPIRFTWKEEPALEQDGFLAHEVSTAVPEAVVGEKDAVDVEGEILPQMTDPGRIVPLLVAAVQELAGRVEILES